MQRRPLLLSFAGAAAAIAAPRLASAQSATPVTIGWGPFPDVPQIAVATDRKMWAADGLDVRIVPFVSGRASFEALIGGQLDYTVMAEFPAVAGAMRNLKFSIVAVLSQYRTFRIVTKGDRAPADLHAFTGKKIAIPLGTNIHFVISDALEKRGITAELVNVPVTEMTTALARGDVDAIMTYPSGYQNSRRVLGAQYQELRLPDYMSSFVLAASEKASANPDLTRRVLATLLKAEAVVSRSATEAQEATSRYVAGAVLPDLIRAAWGDYEYRVKLDAATLDLMVREGQWLKAKGLIKEGNPSPALYRHWMSPEPLRALDATRVTIAG